MGEKADKGETAKEDDKESAEKAPNVDPAEEPPEAPAEEPEAASEDPAEEPETGSEDPAEEPEEALEEPAEELEAASEDPAEELEAASEDPAEDQQAEPPGSPTSSKDPEGVQNGVQIDMKELLPEEECEDAAEEQAEDNKRCSGCSIAVVKGLCLTLVLSTLVVTYAVGGAYLFSHLENKRDIEYSNNIERWKNDTAILLATELRQISPYEGVWARKVYTYLDYFEKDILKASARGYRRKDDWDRGKAWTFKSALFFSFSLMTATGNGALLPRSEWSQFIVIAYSLLGIPLTIAWLVVIGSNLALFWCWIFERCCCPFCNFSSRVHPKDDASSVVELTEEEESNHDYLLGSHSNATADGLVAIFFPLLLVVVYYILGSAGIYFVEGWSISDSFYFNFAMFTTMGPGCQEMDTDISMTSIRENICFLVYMLLGFCLVSMFLNLIYMLSRKNNNC